MDARRVQQDDLVLVLGQHAQHLIARGLRLGAGDGDLLAEQPVQQRRFAHIGPTNDRDKTAAMVLWELINVW